MIYFCCTENRRQAVRDHATLNGIDYLEVLDGLAIPNDQRQRTLFVHFIKSLAGNVLTEKNVRVEGGERIRDVMVTGVTIADKILTVTVKEPGDFSIYTLRLVQDETHPQPPSGFDPLLSAVDFSFKVECPSEFDCEQARVCPPEPRTEPEINYLAKDYGSFRQLMLDRMASLTPQWRERNPADLGIALVEALAYVGDYLSYQQDAVATEAYLGTARRRVSVRRHARLVDYAMHDGSNARVWVQLRSGSDNVLLGKGTKLLTRVPGLDARFPPNSPDYERALAARPEVFETMHPVTLWSTHNDLHFYTWGAVDCCLPKGATRATLKDHLPNLKKGDVLIFKELVDPETGKAGDANPAHRHAVRLTDVKMSNDPLGGRFLDPPNDNPVEITEIEWDAADALPFPLCVSAGDLEVSVALGNIVLADHGMTVASEPLGNVPEPTLSRIPSPSADRCQPQERKPILPRFRPRLSKGPLTQAATVAKTDSNTEERLSFDPAAPASAAFQWSMPDVFPAISLTDDRDHKTWRPRRDLLSSDRFAPEFIAEVEADGSTTLRLGDDQHGLRPAGGTGFDAIYRVGNGARGNIGAETIAHIVTSESAITKVSNPLPARGGVDAESIEQARQSAPFAFRTQERAVTQEDYAAVAERHLQIQRAAATFRWTGSWRTVFVTVDREGGLPVDEPFEQKIRGHLERFRMAGYDLEVDGPRFVSLEIEMHVCVKPDYFRSEVKRALLEVFSNRVLPDGRRGVFHPDNFTFGQPVYLSPLYAAAQATAGVDSVVIKTFQRQGNDSREAIDQGFLALGRIEIARLDNDPNFPERGVLRLEMEGGK